MKILKFINFETKIYDFAYCIYNMYEAMTDKTSTSILLNSSKQLQAPAELRPLKNFAME